MTLAVARLIQEWRDSECAFERWWNVSVLNCQTTKADELVSIQVIADLLSIPFQEGYAYALCKELSP